MGLAMKTQAPHPHEAAARDAADAPAREPADDNAEAGFRAWLATHPIHRQMYESLESSLDGVQDLPQERPLLRDAGPLRRARKARAAPRAGTGRRIPRAVMLSVALAVVGGGWMGWDHWRNEPTFTKEFTVAAGQHFDVELPDGSALELGAATQAQVRLYRDHREVTLRDGQAMFTVSHDPAKPFDVLAGMVRVRVVGTRFSVRHAPSGMDAGKTVVAVEAGRVRVSQISSPEDSGVELGAGQSVTADEGGGLQAVVDPLH